MTTIIVIIIETMTTIVRIHMIAEDLAGTTTVDSGAEIQGKTVSLPFDDKSQLIRTCLQ